MDHYEHTIESVLAWLKENQKHKDYVDDLVDRGSFDISRKLQAVEGLNGDPTFAKTYLVNLTFRLATGRRLDDFDCAALGLFLARIVNSDEGLNIASGNAGKSGAPKKGHKGLMVAYEVAVELRNDVSVEEAWNRVADRLSVSQSSVKKNWIKWKPKLLEVFKSSLGNDEEGVAFVMKRLRVK